MPEIPWTPSPDDFDDMWDNAFVAGDGPPEYVPDMLCTMFAQQLAHMQKYMQINEAAWLPPEHWGDLKRPDVEAALRENAGYVIEELMEAIGLLKNKPWTQTAKVIDKGKFREELADVWHFFIQLHILAGLSPLEVFQDYFHKSVINQNRQNNGY